MHLWMWSTLRHIGYLETMKFEDFLNYSWRKHPLKGVVFIVYRSSQTEAEF